MKHALLGLLVVLSIRACLAADAVPPPAVAERYALDVAFDLAQHRVAGEATVTVKNSGRQPLRAVPFILYRLMDFQSAADASGKPLRITQNIVKFSDDPTWQVNSAEVELPAALAPEQTATIRLRYAGPLLGLREVMQYVRDTVDGDYTLLRAEPIPYPMLGPAAYKTGWSRFLDLPMHLDLQATVPSGYTAVCVIPQAGEPRSQGANIVFRCSGDAKGSAINLAIAKFRVLKDTERGFEVYAMPQDAAAADRVLEEMRRSLAFFQSYLGAMPGSASLKLVEIPEGWGSYGMYGTIFQAGAAFKEKDSANELWHEVAHRWNACQSMDRDRGCERLVVRARWFDEAFASFFEALAIRQFNGEDAFHKRMEANRQYFLRRSERDPRGRTTAITDYGKEELGGFSYTKGAWSLYVLQQYLGEEAFRKAISDFLHEYADKPANFDDFRRAVEKSSGKDIGAWYREWMLSGPDSSDMLLQGKSVDEMVAKLSPKK